MDLSVIICCYNGKRRLRKTIEHLALQKTNLQWEFVLVDNASTDGSAAYVQKVWEELHPNIVLRIVIEKEPGLIYARRCGVRAAKGKYIIFCDDDNWLREDYIQSAYELMEQMPNVGVLCGQGDLAPGIVIPDWWEGNQCNYAAGKQLPCSGYANERGFLSGAGMTTRTELARKIFNDAYPFLLTGRKGNACLSGEDWEYCRRIMMMGADLYYCEKLFYWHDIDASRLTKEYLQKLLHSFQLGKQIYEKYQFASSFQKENRWRHIFQLIVRLWTYLLSSINGKQRKKDLLYIHACLMGIIRIQDKEMSIIKGFMQYAEQTKRGRKCY